MKKNFIYALMSAIALTGAVGISSCSSSEDVVDVNPTYDGEAVKTQFTISLPFNKNTTTRQTYSIVQEAQTIASFRGMSGIVLIPFQSADRTTRLGANITLGENKMVVPTTSNGENSIPSGRLLGTSNAVLYNDVTIPVGTSGFLFYGKAPESTGNEFEEGRLTADGLTGETSGISFTPTPILTGTLAVTTRDNIITYINSIAAATDNNGTTDDTADDITWAGCNISTNSWYNAGLGAMYEAFTSMRAGASSYVMAAVQDLYKSIYKNTDKVSVAIRTAILNAEYASDAGNSGTLLFTEKIKGALVDTKNVGFPEDNQMPEGAAALSWTANASNILQASAANSNYGGPTTSGEGLIPEMNIVAMTDIVYPASLYYYVDSPIKTSNTVRIDDYNDIDKTQSGSQLGTWNQILATYDGTSVSSVTRSVAIQKPIQYAVGRLDVTVNALGTAPHYDRKGDVVAFPDGATAQTFPLTGVLIGGQKAVGYQFTPTGTTGTTEYTIYDKTIYSETTGTSPVYDYIASSTAAGPTYTLALETVEDTPVYVALEFVNNANDFQGYDGVVKHGCKFYMIAKLNPSINVEGQVSGVDASKGINKVFIQDYKTIANFSFGAGTADTDGDGAADTIEGFGNAYTTIPDLRAPKLELGLSVDLTWEQGITFNVKF